MIGIIKGLAVTLRHQFSRAITVQYPKEKLEITPRSRGWIKLDADACPGCGICAKACPISVITVEAGTGADGKRIVQHWEVRTDRCMFCGICSEACPRGSLTMIPAYELATTNKNEIRNIQADSEIEPGQGEACEVEACPLEEPLKKDDDE